MKRVNVAFFAAVACSALGVQGPAQAGVIFTEDFNSSVVGSSTIPTGTLFNNVKVENSADYRNFAGGVNDTGTVNFLSFGAGDTANNGIAALSVDGLTAGHVYNLSFLYGSFSTNFGSTQSIFVQDNGNPIALLSTPGSTNDLSHVFNPFSFNFTAPGTSVVLSFTDKSGSTASVDGLLDNVSVSTAIPEPSTWAMMLFGFVGIGFLTYRRSRKGTVVAAA